MKIKDLPNIVPCLFKSEVIGNKQQSAFLIASEGWRNRPRLPAIALAEEGEKLITKGAENLKDSEFLHRLKII